MLIKHQAIVTSLLPPIKHPYNVSNPINLTLTPDPTTAIPTYQTLFPSLNPTWSLSLPVIIEDYIKCGSIIQGQITSDDFPHYYGFIYDTIYEEINIDVCGLSFHAISYLKDKILNNITSHQKYQVIIIVF